MSSRLNRTRGTGLVRSLRRPSPQLQRRLPRTWNRQEPGIRFWAAPANSRTTSDETVLIVDDEGAIRLICRLNLGSSGFGTLEAGDGERAVALARAEQPDLILLDVMLPGMDGWQVAEQLAQMPETREIPILFLSARSDRNDESRGFELGGVGYIRKPFDPNELTDRVRDVLERMRGGEREELRREWQERIGRD
jgi:putative two-component system response regulator